MVRLLRRRVKLRRGWFNLVIPELLREILDFFFARRRGEFSRSFDPRIARKNAPAPRGDD
jgi:hypothetical protein